MWRVFENLLSFIENYKALQLEWDLCLAGQLDLDRRASITGVKAQIETFDYFFSLHLGERIYSHTNNLSKSLQHSKLAAINGQISASLVCKVLQTMRTSDNFQVSFSIIKKKAAKMNAAQPVLHASPRFEVDEGLPMFATTCDDHYRQIYFKAIDLSVNAIHIRFD